MEMSFMSRQTTGSIIMDYWRLDVFGHFRRKHRVRCYLGSTSTTGDVPGISLVEIAAAGLLSILGCYLAGAGAGTRIGDVCLSRSRARTISFNSATSGDTLEVEALVLTLATMALLRELRTLDLLSMMLEQSAGLLSKKLPPAAESIEWRQSSKKMGWKGMNGEGAQAWALNNSSKEAVVRRIGISRVEVMVIEVTMCACGSYFVMSKTACFGKSSTQHVSKLAASFQNNNCASYPSVEPGAIMP
ncbi:hypothetical protein Tco_1320064 [Tanacetum coccineum]